MRSNLCRYAQYDVAMDGKRRDTKGDDPFNDEYDALDMQVEDLMRVWETAGWNGSCGRSRHAWQAHMCCSDCVGWQRTGNVQQWACQRAMSYVADQQVQPLL